MQPPSTSTVVLHIEELAKRHYDVKTKHGRTHRKKYYDVDWRFYIAHKYGQYVLCGTRCPMYDTYNEEWPVISTSFGSVREVFEYISLLVGDNKINATLFVSESKVELESGSAYMHSDLAFSHPTNKRFRALDAERKNRRTELVGYDHFRISPTTGCFDELKVIRLLKMLSVLNSGNMVPFGVSPHPSLRTFQRGQEEEEEEEAEAEEEDDHLGQAAAAAAAAPTSADASPVSETTQLNADCDDAFHYDYYDYRLGDFYSTR